MCPCHGLVDSVSTDKWKVWTGKWDLEEKSEEDGMEKNHQEDQVDGGIKKEDGMCVSGFWGQHKYSSRLDV